MIKSLVALGVIVFTNTMMAPAQTPCDREVLVNVTAENGEPVAGLAPDVFATRLGKQTISPKIALAAFPARFVILLDKSRSITNRRSNQPLMLAIAKHVVNALPRGTRIAGASFTEQFNLVQEFEEDGNLVIEKLAADLELKDKKDLGQTGLLDAMLKATQLFGNHQTGDSLLVFTDGGDNRSRTTDAKALALLRDSGVRVYFVGIFTNLHGAVEEEIRGPYLMERFATETGGAFFRTDYGGEIDDKHDQMLRPAAQAIARRISGGYLFIFPIPPEATKRLELKVQIKQPSKHKLFLEYPHWVASCAPYSAAPALSGKGVTP
jgi:hypothetical protein